MLPSRHALRIAASALCALLAAACSTGTLRREPAAPSAPAPIERHRPLAQPARTEPKAPADTRTEGREETEADAPADLWGKLPALFRMPTPKSPDVAREVEWLSNNPAYIERVSLNAAPYLYYIVSQLEARQLPGELALLPILESGYDASARSPYGAVGLWQFMGGTGDKMGLSITPWFDGRADVEKSTTAALDYLQVLQKQFSGDWFLAIAAYNLGWGTVERSLANQRRRGVPIDFWTLEGTRASRQLVARLLALATVLRDRERYSLRFLPIPNRPYFGRVTLTRPTDLSSLPARLGVDAPLFRRLNPGWRHGHTGPLAEAQVLVPLDRLPQAEAAVAKLPASPVPALPAPTRRGQKGSTGSQVATTEGGGHRISAGDSLWTVAAKYGTTVEALLAANPGVTRKSVLALGQQLKLPKRAKTTGGPAAQAAGQKSQASAPTAARSAGKSPRAPSAPAKHYKVKQGDSLWTIARQFKVSIEDLLAWNRLKRDAQLNLGQDLVVSPAS